MALKERLREEKKKLAEAQAKASQKGPMGEFILYRYNTPNEYRR